MSGAPEPAAVESGSWWLQQGPAIGCDGPEVLAGARPELVIVGMGASGLEAAVLAAERGAAVLVLDSVGVAAGAAGSNGGFLLAGLADFHHDAVARLGRRVAVDWWRRTEAELDRVAAQGPGVRRTGSLRIAASAEEERDVAAQLAQMRADGIAVEDYDGPEGRGLRVPGDAAVDPAARCRWLAARAQAAGATLVAPARVEMVRPGGIRVARRWLATPRVLVCVDGGVEALVLSHPDRTTTRPLAGRARTARLQMLATAPTDEVQIVAPVYSRHGYDYVQQLPTGQVLLGGGRDVGGASEWAPPGAVARQAQPSTPVQRHLDAWLADLAPSATITHRWAAWAAFTADRMPVDLRLAPGVHAVGGYSGHGNLLGGLLARAAAADLLDGRA